MAVNLAQKYSPKVSERLKRATVIGGLTNSNYEFTGVDTVKIYSVGTFAMNDYNPSGDNRYGSTEEITNSLQTWQLAQDRSFSGSIDAKNNMQSMGVMKPGSVLARQIREVVVPEVDTYVLQVMGTFGATYDRDDIVADAVTDATNAFVNFLAINANIQDNEGAQSGLKSVMTAAYYNFLKQGGFVLDSDSAYRDRKTGNLGTVDGNDVRIAPSSRMPANTDLITVHSDVVTFADVLTDYNTSTNPKGINGVLIEGRLMYDAFGDVNQKYNIGIHKTA